MSIWDKIKERASEPSTWAGVALATQGATQIFKLDYGQQAAEALNATGQAIGSSGGDWKAGAFTLLFGLVAMMKKEKGSK